MPRKKARKPSGIAAMQERFAKARKGRKPSRGAITTPGREKTTKPRRPPVRSSERRLGPVARSAAKAARARGALPKGRPPRGVGAITTPGKVRTTRPTSRRLTPGRGLGAITSPGRERTTVVRRPPPSRGAITTPGRERTTRRRPTGDFGLQDMRWRGGTETPAERKRRAELIKRGDLRRRRTQAQRLKAGRGRVRGR